MWIFTKQGFFSAVEDRNDPDQIMVRSRVREDLEELIGELALLQIHHGWPGPEPEILEWTGTDYAYRIFIPREAWRAYLDYAGEDLDYTNFKAAVTYAGSARSSAYHAVWSRLKSWQDQERIYGGGGPGDDLWEPAELVMDPDDPLYFGWMDRLPFDEEDAGDQ